ncbi:hypothetical protein CEXT_771171 [Caerostris extrusa]|uniref:Ribosomal protein S18 n=1 Tax=Caerostris extrusa TaxID=172846 RepID=A0AAV4PML4_CAEEX|nr:hypothetical protein CEXT_771171 [Caerostris extrusa]
MACRRPSRNTAQELLAKPRQDNNQMLTRGEKSHGKYRRGSLLKKGTEILKEFKKKKKAESLVEKKKKRKTGILRGPPPDLARLQIRRKFSFNQQQRRIIQSGSDAETSTF